MDELEEIIRAEHVSIGVITTPPGAAQQVCDRLVAAGVTSILNFAPTVLSVPDGVDVRKVDLSIELQILAFHEQRKSGEEHLADEPPAVVSRPGAGAKAVAAAAARRGLGAVSRTRGKAAGTDRGDDGDLSAVVSA